jgi:hypothetical protein
MILLPSSRMPLHATTEQNRTEQSSTHHTAMQQVSQITVLSSSV